MVLEMDETSIRAVKNVTFNEPHFQGHFPQQPVMPGVLIIEAMAQTAGAICIRTLNAEKPSLVYFMTIDNAKFREPLRPGQTVTTRCHWETASSERQAAITLTVSDRPASTFVLVARTAKSPPG